MKPRLLDLYSCAGGCARGYADAGFDVTGVDINSQPRYPYPHIVADALEYVAAHGHEYDAIHASPPCQLYSKSTVMFRAAGKEYPDLIGPTRDALIAVGRPWVIENVPGSPVRADYLGPTVTVTRKPTRTEIYQTLLDATPTQLRDALERLEDAKPGSKARLRKHLWGTP